MSKEKKTVADLEVAENGSQFLDKTDLHYVIEEAEKKIIFCKDSGEYKKYIKEGIGESYEYIDKYESYKLTENEKEKNVFVLLILNSGKHLLVRKWKSIF